MNSVYLYQTLHTLDYHARMLEAHVTLLDHWSQRLFGHPYTPNLKQLEARIRTLLETERRTRDLSVFIRLAVDPKGQEILTTEGVSLYRGYALRSLRPEAAIIPYDLPHPEAPSSAREAAAELTRIEAGRTGAQVVVRCDGNGILHTIDNASLFAIQGKQVHTTHIGTSIESQLFTEAARRAGLTITKQPPLREAITSYDELLGFDHRGVTAISHCGKHPYLDILARRIAREIEGLFQ